MRRTKEEWEEIVGHTMRIDTYLVLERIQDGETYEEIIRDLDQNREKYRIKNSVSLVKPKTIEQYLALIDVKLIELENKQRVVLRHGFEHITGYGVYGIYVNDKIIYIGQTQDFRRRFVNHHSGFNCSNKPLYKHMRLEKQKGNQVSIKPIINVEDLQTETPITERDLQAMELALITLYKPPYNYEGIVIPYVFGNKRQRDKQIQQPVSVF